MTATLPDSGRPALPCGPAPDGSDAEFWTSLDSGRLVLPRCRACETWRPPGHPLCSACWSFETDWVEVPATGTVFSWIRSHRMFMDELDAAVPYDTVLVQLDAAPVRLLGLLIGLDTSEPAIGDHVDGVVEKPGNAAWSVLRWRRREVLG